jgi:hypothetical protein
MHSMHELWNVPRPVFIENISRACWNVFSYNANKLSDRNNYFMYYKFLQRVLEYIIYILVIDPQLPDFAQKIRHGYLT